jgi:hypothetical protein
MSRRSTTVQVHLQTLAANLTASEGPLRAAVDELGRIGIGARIVKSALAATLAWYIAGFLPRETAPFVAALTALFTMDLTILKSLTGAGQRFAGILVGIGMAFLAAEFLGVHAWSVGLLILGSMVVGLRLNLKPEGMAQVASTAIVVLVVRTNTEERGIYALTFLADTAIGTAIGLTVNALLIPPNYLPGAQRTLNLLIARLIDMIDQLATLTVDGITSDETEALADALKTVASDLRNVDESLEQASEGIRFNVMAAQQRDRLDHFKSVDARLSDVISALQSLVQSLSRAVHEPWMRDRDVTEALADLISASSVMLIAQGTAESSDQADSRTRLDVISRLDQLERQASARSAEAWISLGHVVGCARDLADAATALNRNA